MTDEKLERCEAWQECGETECDFYGEHSALPFFCDAVECGVVGRIVCCVPVEKERAEVRNE